MAAIIPFTFWLTGTTIGIPAAVVPMIAAGVPFFGRLVENALRELPAEVTAVGIVCGGSRWQIIRSAQLSEALPALVAAVTLNLVSMIEYFRHCRHHRRGRDRLSGGGVRLPALRQSHHDRHHYRADRHYPADSIFR
nr:methionine ABC transporter permease [Raoultella sp. NCTC 9187]